MNSARLISEKKAHDRIKKCYYKNFWFSIVFSGESNTNKRKSEYIDENFWCKKADGSPKRFQFKKDINAMAWTTISLNW